MQQENLLTPGRQILDGASDEIELLPPVKLFLWFYRAGGFGIKRFDFRGDAGVARLRTLPVDGSIQRCAPQQRKRLSSRGATRALQQLQAKIMHHVASERTPGKTAAYVIDQVLIVSDQRQQQGLVVWQWGHDEDWRN